MSETLQESSLRAARSAIDRNAWQDAFDLYKQAPETQPLGPVDLEEFATQPGRLPDSKITLPRLLHGHFRDYRGAGEPPSSSSSKYAVASSGLIELPRRQASSISLSESALEASKRGSGMRTRAEGAEAPTLSLNADEAA